MKRSDCGARYWVLIESGSNQEFILQSTRRRFQVAASALVKDLATWVRDAVASRAAGKAIDLVVCTSSKALLLVADQDAGRAIVSDVLATTLSKAPGMDVWGYVDDVPLESGQEMGRLDEVHRKHAALRWTRPTPRQRFPQRPFLETCSVTGVPAVESIPDPAKPGMRAITSASALTARVYAKAPRAIEDLRKPYGDAVQGDLNKELLNAGWIGVVHADGNGIGDIIAGINDLERYRRFSKGLEEATSAAFAAAVRSVSEQDWLIPLIVGGDDVTFLCDGRRALAVTRAYLTEFERFTADFVAGLGGPDGQSLEHLTACAGVAFVKPNFPFHAAHELAEELCRSAKRATKVQASGRSSYDFHVLHDSVLRPLASIRDDLVTRYADADLDLWASPFLAPSAASVLRSDDWVQQHEDTLLHDAVDTLRESERERAISGSAMSRLRDALRRGGPAIDMVRQRVLVGAPGDVRAFIDEQVIVPNSTPTFSRFLAIHDAADVAAGVLSGARATRPTTEEATHA